MLTFQQQGRPPQARMARATAAILFAILVGLGCHHGVGAQGPGDIACDAPLGIDEAMLFLRGFRCAWCLWIDCDWKCNASIEKR